MYRALCNRLTGFIILGIFKDRVPSLRWIPFAFDLTSNSINKPLVASVFWGFYESAEIRLINKYLDGEIDVIELGASSGIVSSFIISKFRNANIRLISVEANKNLADSWKSNVTSHNLHNTRVDLLNRAVHYGKKFVNFNVSGNPTESRLSNSENENWNEEDVKVECITLEYIVDTYGVSSFGLFCDIEGAEIELLLNEGEIFKKCKYLFIELHKTVYKQKQYEVEDLKSLIIRKGFIVVAHYGPVYYFISS